MTIFTYITGIVTLLGFLIQLKDIFPEHRESRKSLLLIVAGFFLGSLISTLQGGQFSIQLPGNPLLLFGYLILIVLFLFLFVVALLAITTNDKQKKQHFLGFFGGAFAIFCVIGFVMILSVGVSTVHPVSQVTVDELIIMSKQRLMEKNYDRSIVLLEIALSQVDSKDARHQLLKQEIDSLKQLQIDQIRK